MLAATPVVTLGDVHNATEGFGFGSTIDGLGQSLDLNGSRYRDGSLRFADVGNRPLDPTSGGKLGLTKSSGFTQEFLLYQPAGATGDIYSWGTGVSTLATVSAYNNGRGLHIGGPFGSQDLDNALNVDAWNEIAQTYDGSHLQLYINGVQVLTTDVTLKQGEDLEPRRLTLGSEGAAIDELRIWNVARTEAEIQKSMFVPLTGIDKGLVGYWQFNGNLTDASGKSANFDNTITGTVQAATYFDNAEPQVGWVDVSVNIPVTAGTGLFVSYQITGGDATLPFDSAGKAVSNADFYSSRFRTVSSDPSTETLGIIIPQGEQKGRIYFIAKSDAIAEPTETVSIKLTNFPFPQDKPVSDYTIGSTSPVTVQIFDNGAYRPGLGLFDAAGRSFSPAGNGVIPFSINPNDPYTDIQVALTSQPTSNVSLRIFSYDAPFMVTGNTYPSQDLTFTPDNWETRQTLRIATKNLKTTQSLISVSNFGSSYLPALIDFPYTTIGGIGKVTEGNDPAATPPTVQIAKTRDALEGDFAGGQFHLDLSSPAPSGGLDVRYTYKVNSLTTINSFSGGDAGEGLDLSGNFVYAIDLNGSSNIKIGDATFTPDNVSGFTFSAPQQIVNYSKAEFGSSTNDNNLETVIKSIRWNVAPGAVTAQLANLIPGTEYKLQLMFAESGSDRGFNVFVDGQKIANNFNPGNVQGGRNNTTQGAVITYQFVATKNTADIRLDGAGTPFPDKNPILNALTLEQLPPLFVIPPSGMVHFPEGVMSEDLGIVIADNSTAGPATRELTVSLADDPTTFQRATGHSTASMQIVEDDKPSIEVSNFTEFNEFPPTFEPNETEAQATKLGNVVAGMETPGTVSTSNDQDYYSFSIDRSVADVDQIMLTGPTNTGAAYLTATLFYGDQTYNLLLLNATSATADLPKNYSDFKIVVHGENGKTGDYKLSFIRNGLTAEPNDTFANATDLATVRPGLAAIGSLQPINGSSDDYYKFTLDDTSASITGVTITFDSDKPMTVGLYDSKVLLDSASHSNLTFNSKVTLSFALGAAVLRGNGTYYLKLSGQRPPNGWKYSVQFQGQLFDRTGGTFTETYAPVVLKESPNAPVPRSLGLRLTSQPAGLVTLNLTTKSSGSIDAATLSTTSLTFTPGNWNVYQKVSVTPIDDRLLDGDQQMTITATASSTDLSFNGKILKFDAVVQDDETPASPDPNSRTQDTNLPQVFLTKIGSKFSENASSNQTNFTVALSKPVTTDTYIGLDLNEGTAVAGQDFLVAADFTRDYQAADLGLSSLKIPAGSNSPAFVDINGDGLLDMFLGSSSGGVAFYLNVGTRTAPRFELQTGAKDPLNGLNTDKLGGTTRPAFIDVNGDGVMDLLIGSKTGLTYYRNDGTKTAPKFVEVPLGSSPFRDAVNLTGAYFAPAFADLNGDGRLDLFVASEGNSVAAYFENRGTGVFTSNVAGNPLSALGLAGAVKPALLFADINGDGLQDAVISLSSGNFAKINLGTPTAPRFDGTSIPRFFRVTSNVTGATWGTGDLNGDGVPELIAGTSKGELRGFMAYSALFIPAGSTHVNIPLLSVNDLIAQGDRTVGVRVLESPFYMLTPNHSDVQQDVVDTYDANQNGNTKETLPGIFSATFSLEDNDKAGFVTVASDTKITEDGKTVPLQIKLTSQPISDVTVYVGSSDATAGLISTGGTPTATGTITFTAANWNVFQTVNITPVNDSTAYGTRYFNVLVSSTGNDPAYRKLDAPLLKYQTTDNDTAGIIVSGPQDTVPGKSNVIGVKLATQPVGEVRVTLTTDNAQVRFAGTVAGTPYTMVFNQNNWNLQQRVEVNAADDGLIEYVHKSRISFSVQTGRVMDGPPAAKISDSTLAYDLGSITGGLTWTNLPFDTTLQPGGWLKFNLTTQGSDAQTIRATAPDFASGNPVRLSLYDTSLNLITTGKTTDTTYDNNGNIKTDAFNQLSLSGLKDGTYLLKLDGVISTHKGFPLVFSSADQQFEKLTLNPIDFSITDNDLPTASVVAGPSASELSSTPSYFAVKLNAPATAAAGNTGVRVKFAITGGRAIVGDASSGKHDYSVVADSFTPDPTDPTKGTGYVRIAPGDVQANIGIIPVDDKLVEALPLTLSGFGYFPTLGYVIRVAVNADVGDNKNPDHKAIDIPKGTRLVGRLPSGREVTFQVREATQLVYGTYDTVEYAAGVKVDATQDVIDAATAVNSKTSYTGFIKSQDVQVTLLPGDGYILPLAPDKQNLDPTSPTVKSNIANFDPARITAGLEILDDDVPGIQVIRVGDDDNIAEGDTATYAVSLTSEPSQSVTVRLTPDGQFEFVNPAASTKTTITTPTYSIQSSTVPSDLDLRLGSVLKTDLGWTVSLDARLRQSSYNGINIPLQISDSTDTSGKGSDKATFEIPNADATDAAGKPLVGNWNQYQHLVVSNLTPLTKNGDYFELSVLLNGVKSLVRVNVNANPPTQSVSTTDLTFSPDKWYQAQNIVIRVLPNKVAEPGDWHEGLISAKFTTGDATWKGTSLTGATVHLADQQLQGGQTAQALQTGFGVLKDSLDSVKLPLVGNLLSAAPELSGFFDEALAPLVKALKSQKNLSVTELQKISQSAIPTNNGPTLSVLAASTDPTVFSAEVTADPADTADAGFFDTFEVEPAATEDEVTLHLTLEKTWHLLDLNLSSDIGLDALGLSLKTEGSLTADVTFKLDFVIGLSRTFGFFIDTTQTGMDVDASLGLDGFSGTGGLGFLKLDFNDDPENPSSLSVHFHAGLNDLNNRQTIQFFDVNGDGLLQSGTYVTRIGTDTNHDNLIDKNAEGQQVLSKQTVAEPFINVNARGVTVNPDGSPADFPTVSSLSGTSLDSAKNANWNGNNTFDEAVSITNEGVYRTKTLNGRSIVYFDANNNGQLDIGKRNVDPFTTSWSSLHATATTRDYTDSSELWVSVPASAITNPSTLPIPFKILSQVTGPATKPVTTYYFDANKDGRPQATEVISAKLRKSLDKNKNGTLDANIQKDGEGVYVQGTGIAFADSNGNGRLDDGEKFVNSGFGDLTFPDVGEAGYAGLVTPYLVQHATQPNGNVVDFIDLNGGGLDAFDPQAPAGEEITVPTKVGSATMFVTVKISQDAGGRFLDFNGNGVRNTTSDLTKPEELYIDTKDAGADQTLAERFHIAPDQTTFTFFDADGNGQVGIKDIAVLISHGKQYLDLDHSGTLTVSDDDTILEPFAVQNNTFDLNALKNGNGGSNGTIIQLLNDNGRLTLTELLNFTRQVRSQNVQHSDQLKAEQSLFNYTFEGAANLGLHAVTSVDGNEAFPSFTFDVAANFPLFNYNNESEAAETGFTIQFNNVEMDLGSFMTQFVEPILNTVDEVLTPIKPIVQVLNSDTKVMDALGLGSVFESDGRPGVSLLEIARKFAAGNDPLIAKIDAAIKFANTIQTIVDLVDTLKSTLADGENGKIDFGSFTVPNLRAASDDIANSASHARRTSPANPDVPRTTAVSQSNGSQPLTRDSGQAAQTAMVDQTAKKSNLFKKLTQLDGFKFNLFNPDTVMSLLMGEPAVDIVTYDVPDFQFDSSITQKFSIWGPLAGLIQGGFSVSTDISVGFDTAGIDKWKEDGFDPAKSYEVFDGFYVNDWSPSGVDKNELQVNAFIAVGAGLNLGIVSGFVRGGLRGDIGLDLIDSGERSGESDGKIRGSDIISAFSHNPLDLFELNGKIEAFLGAIVEVDFFFFSEIVYEKDFATFKLAEFKLDSSGFSGSSDFGKAQGGTISGGFVWLDANNNDEYDSGEPSTLTNSDGTYQLIIPDGYDVGSGIVRIRGGVDVTTGVAQTTTLSKHLGESVATPFTTLAEQVAATPINTSVIDFVPDNTIDSADADKFYELYASKSLIVDLNKDNVVDERDISLFELDYEIAEHGGIPTLKEAEQLILIANGIDPDLDLSNFAHLDATLANNPNAGAELIQVDSYESLIIGVKAFLTGVAGVANDDPTTEVIFTNAIDRAIAQQIVTGSVDLTNPATVAAIIRDAVTFANQAFASAGMSIVIDSRVVETKINAVTTVLVDDTLEMQMLVQQATTPLELAALVTKVKLSDETSRADDLSRFAQGQITEQQLLSADAVLDAAELDRIRNLKLPPMIGNIGDQHISENSSVTNAHFVAFDLDSPTSALKVSVSSDNPDLIPAANVSVVPQSAFADWVLNITPLTNASGTAQITLTFTDESGKQASKTFAVTVDPVNQAPQAHNDSINATGDLSVTFDPRSNDTDAEGDLLSASLMERPRNGLVVENPDGTFTYTANPGFFGQDTAQYAVSDGHNGVSTATLTFNVGGALTARFNNPISGVLNGPVSSVDVTFSRPVDTRTLSVADFQLTRDGRVVPLTSGQQIVLVSGTTYRLLNLSSVTSMQGTYELSVDTRTIKDSTGVLGVARTSERWAMDNSAPSSQVQPLPAYSASLDLNIRWSGADNTNGSGLTTYNVYVSDNGGPYVRWLTSTTNTSQTYSGENGHTYRFYSIASDYGGNVESAPRSADATTKIDITAPTSHVTSLPATIGSNVFRVFWSGSDGAAGSGIARYDVYVSDNGSAYRPLISGTTDTSTSFTGEQGHTYAFYSVATDRAGNVQSIPTAADATTTISIPPRYQPPVALEGSYFDSSNRQASVIRTGNFLIFINGSGRSTVGWTESRVQVLANPSSGLRAVFDPTTGSLMFSDGTVWNKVPQLAGTWLTGGGRSTVIQQIGTTLLFSGNRSGSILSPNNIAITRGANLTGTLVSNGHEIHWSDGSVWNQVPILSGDWIDQTGSPTAIEQSGASLTFVNSRGQTATGSFIDSRHVIVPGWGNLTGTLQNGAILWSDGTSWSTVDPTGGRPDIAGRWSVGNNNVRILQNDGVLTFINANGGTSRGHFLSNTRIVADDWNLQGDLIGNVIIWRTSSPLTNGRVWIKRS